MGVSSVSYGVGLRDRTQVFMLGNKLLYCQAISLTLQDNFQVGIFLKVLNEIKITISCLFCNKLYFFKKKKAMGLGAGGRI